MYPDTAYAPCPTPPGRPRQLPQLLGRATRRGPGHCRSWQCLMNDQRAQGYPEISFQNF